MLILFKCAHAGIESSLGVDVQMPIEEVLPNDDGISVPLPTYTVWLDQWTRWVQSEPARIRVPLKACPIMTLDLSVWRQVLLSYPDRSLANFFLQGVTQGFRVGYRTLLTHLSTARQNMRSALAHPEVVEEYLAKERRDGRVLGPFPLHRSMSVVLESSQSLASLTNGDL